MQTATVYKSIEFKLKEAFKPARLAIFDDSQKHAGHDGMKGITPNESHFRVEICSAEFEGKTLLQRHRLIHAVLGDELKSKIHALQLSVKTPNELDIK